MAFDPGKIFENFVSLFVRLPLAQKIALPALLAGSMGLIIFVSNWASRPEYRVLFSGLDDADAGSVVEYLKDHKIGYKLSNDGSTVEITPPSMVHDIRLELSSAGLPNGKSKGFELFDRQSIGATSMTEWVNQQRAIQGELERTIQAIEAIKTARVHITVPKKSEFVKRDVMPTAAVLIKLKAAMELTPAQVKGIAHLVAGSVERLTPENVSIMDSRGNLLNEKKDEAAAQGADVDRLNYQRQIEASLSKRIESMLVEILGPGRAIARVTADLDFSKFEKEEEIYDPAGAVARSERAVEEGSSASIEGGITGVVANLTNAPGLVGGNDAAKNSGRRESVRNYELSRAVSKTSSAVGKISRLSVAVLVDGQYAKVPTGANDAGGKPVVNDQYKPLPLEMMRKIENLVKQSVGLDPARGDSLTVENIRFISDDPIEAALKETEPTFVERWVYPNVIPLIFVLLFFIVIVRPLIRFLVTPSESEVDLSRLLPAGVQELEAELDAERGRMAVVPDLKEPSVNMEELEAILAENSRIVRENPQQAALLIRYWINDGRL
jgi:flagellar M-ring protein FliF